MDLIIVIVVLLIAKNIYQVLKENKARQQQGERPDQREHTRQSSRRERQPEQGWNRGTDPGSWFEYEWLEAPVETSVPKPGKIALKQRESSVPKVKAPHPAIVAEPKPVKSTVKPGLRLPFNGELQSADIASGIIWSQILGPRGGLQRSKR